MPIKSQSNVDHDNANDNQWQWWQQQHVKELLRSDQNPALYYSLEVTNVSKALKE